MRKFADGEVVYFSYRGDLVKGEIVRYDKGDVNGRSPFYVVDIGEYESILLPAHDLEMRFLIGRMAALSRENNGV